MLIISTLILVYAGFFGTATMIGSRLIRLYEDIVSNARTSSEEAFSDQARDALGAILNTQTEATDAKLCIVRDIVIHSARYLEGVYASPESYTGSAYRPTHMSERTEALCSRYMITAGVAEEDVRAELDAISSIESLFAPLEEFNHELVDDLYIGTASGIFYQYTENSSYDPAYVATGREWFKGASANPGEIYWQETRLDSFGRPCITVSLSVAGPDGKTAAVVAADIKFSEFAQSVLADGLGESGTNFILGRDYDFLVLRGAEFETFDMSFSSHFEDADSVIAQIESGEPMIRAVLDGRDVFMAAKVIPSTSWTFCTAVSAEEILEPINTVNAQTQELARNAQAGLRRLAIIFIIGTVASFVVFGVFVSVLGARVSKGITDPISRLAEGVKETGSGNFEKRFEGFPDDEIGELAGRFNVMQEDLLKYTENLRAVTAEKERIGAELDVATRIQADMLPRIFPPFPDRSEMKLYASMTPAKEVGGDFYDFFMVGEDRLALIIGDVSGKGVPAALFMVISKTLIKNRAAQGGTPAEILADVNRQLCEGNESDMFVTCWLGIVELSTGRITAASAGHEFPAVCGADGRFSLFRDKHGFVLAGMEGSKYKDYVFELEKGGSLFVYTDGVPEATDGSGELFGAERMTDALNGAESSDPESLLRAVEKSVLEFVGDAPQFDDLTMLGFTWLGPEDANMRRITLDADVSKLPELTDFLIDGLAGRDCSLKTENVIGVVAEEIFVNIAHYAYPEGNGTAEITMSFEGEDERTAVITFSDSGVAFDPLAKADPDIHASAHDRKIGGIGIFMVREMTDGVEYRRENGRNVLTVRKRI